MADILNINLMFIYNFHMGHTCQPYTVHFVGRVICSACFNDKVMAEIFIRFYLYCGVVYIAHLVGPWISSLEQLVEILVKTVFFLSKIYACF